MLSAPSAWPALNVWTAVVNALGGGMAFQAMNHGLGSPCHLIAKNEGCPQFEGGTVTSGDGQSAQTSRRK